MALLALQFQSCSSDDDDPEPGPETEAETDESSYISIANAVYKGDSFPSATTSEQLGDVQLGAKAEKGAKNSIIVTTDLDIEKFFIGVKGMDGYWEYTPNTTRSDDENTYQIPLTMGPSIPDNSTILISGQLGNGNITPPVQQQIYFSEDMPEGMKLTDVEKLTFNINFKVKNLSRDKEEKLSWSFTNFDDCTITQEGSTVHLEFTLIIDDDYGAGGKDYFSKFLSFDIEGYEEKSFDDKYGHVYASIKNLEFNETWNTNYSNHSPVEYTMRETKLKVGYLKAFYGGRPEFIEFGGTLDEWGHVAYWSSLELFTYQVVTKDRDEEAETDNYQYVEDDENCVSIDLRCKYTK